MARVYNWHLGRDMVYPYEAAYPERQFAFVFNIASLFLCPIIPCVDIKFQWFSGNDFLKVVGFIFPSETQQAEKMMR